MKYGVHLALGSRAFCLCASKDLTHFLVRAVIDFDVVGAKNSLNSVRGRMCEMQKNFDKFRVVVIVAAFGFERVLQETIAFKDNLDEI